MSIPVIIYCLYTISSFREFLGCLGIALGFGIFIGLFFLSLIDENYSTTEKTKEKTIKVIKYMLISLIAVFTLKIFIPKEETMKYMVVGYVIEEGYKKFNESELINSLGPKAGKIVNLYLDQVITDLEPKEEKK